MPHARDAVAGSTESRSLKHLKTLPVEPTTSTETKRVSNLYKNADVFLSFWPDVPNSLVWKVTLYGEQGSLRQRHVITAGVR